MKETDWDRIQQIYHEARNVPRAERSAFVEKISNGDTVLASEVIELLALDDLSFLTSPIGNLPLVSSEDNLVGETIDNRYLIEKKLGGGGMGRVYLAQDLKVNGRVVVIKFLLRELLENAYARQKFKQEAEALSRIRHTGIVEVLDTGELADGRPFFVMQYVDGETLDSQIPAEGMPLERAASILKQIGEALEHVHQQGVFHRDLKPNNIILRSGTDSVVLVDFGIAKVTNSVVASGTATHASAGTPMYMSPEQLRGEEVTAASDIYSMAVIAYELVTGRLPFNSISPAQRAGVRAKPSDLPSNLSKKAQDIIIRGLSFKPGARYENAKEFGDDLASALLESGVLAKDRLLPKVLMVVLGVALSFGIYWYIGRTAEKAHNRSFRYWLTVQKMREEKEYQEPFKSNGKETFQTGDKYQLNVLTPVPAYLYVINEGPSETYDTNFRMIFPRLATNNGSATVGANQTIQSDWITFRGPAGDDNFWMVWSVSPVAQLESAKTEAFKDPKGGLTGQNLMTVKEFLRMKQLEMKVTVYHYNDNQTAVPRGPGDLLVTLAQFKHR